MSEKPSFFAALKQRKLVQWAVAYIAAAFALLQGIDIVAQQFGWPDGVRRGITLALVVGFFVTLVLAWYHGERGAQRVSGTELLIIGLVLAVGGGFLWHFASAGREPANKVVRDDQTMSVAGTVPEKSIAVLPFENLSRDPDNAYFADGIQDEILTRLSKIAALKVISRTSTQKYKSAPENLRQIGKELGVANLLEGSVQKVGNATHINVQLIRVATDEHLWAESYNRKLDDVFGVEGEVAAAIADQLQANLTGAEEKVLAQKPTNNAAAYEAYLRGATQYAQIYDEVQKAAVTSFEEAVRLDPQFALAWAALSRANSRLFFSGDMTVARRAAAEKALNEATRLQPELAETQLARASYQYWVLHDYPGALEMLQKLQASWPNNADVLEIMAFISARLGQWTAALDYAERSIRLNPKDFSSRLQAIDIAKAMRQFPKVSALIDGGLQIWPNDRNLLGIKAFVAQAKGQLDEADSILQHLPVSTGEEGDAGVVALFYQGWVRRNPSVALKSFDALARGPAGENPTFLLTWALLQNESGKTAEARATATQGVDALAAEFKEQPNNPTIIGPLAFGSAFLDRREESLKLLERYDAAAAGDMRAIGTGHEVRARVLAHLGDKDGAIAALGQLLAAPSDPILGPPVTPALLRLDPDFDSLRGDPRFERLCLEKTN